MITFETTLLVVFDWQDEGLKDPAKGVEKSSEG
jgi:hypothetical protein